MISSVRSKLLWLCLALSTTGATPWTAPAGINARARP